MGHPATTLTISVEDYLRLEEASDVRHEYHRGELFSMAGGTLNHARLGANILFQLAYQRKSSGCNIFSGDARIRIEAKDCFLYPEASVVCGPVETAKDDPNSIINPVLIAEVLSPGTEAYDRGEKFRLYRMLDSFKEYVLINQSRPLVEVFFRLGDVWEMRTYEGNDAQIELKSLSATILLSDLYQHVEFSNEAPRESTSPNPSSPASDL